MGRSLPFQEYLADDEVSALFTPPSFEEAADFAARRFAGACGRGGSGRVALRHVDERSRARAFAGRTGLYLSDVALYMRDLLASLGLSAPRRFPPRPIISLELEVVSYLLDAGKTREACEFLIERFEWLTVYRLKLVEVGREAVFFLAIVDALLGVRACVSELYEGTRK